MNAAIVGAAGFVGRRLAQRLQAQGHRVCGIVRPGARAGGLPFPTRCCDLALEEIPAAGPQDAVFYLAQSTRPLDAWRGVDDLFAVNVVGAIRAAQFALRAGARCFVYVSTGSVYAPCFQPLSEQSPLGRDTAYAKSKIAGEEACALFAGPLRVLCARLFAPFGALQGDRLVQQVAARVAAGKPVVLEPGPPECRDAEGLRVSLCFVDDAVACLARSAEVTLDGKELPGVLNVAGPEAVSVRRLALEIGQLIGRRPRFRTGETVRNGDFVADVTRLRESLAPRFTPLRDALRATIGATTSVRADESEEECAWTR